MIHYNLSKYKFVVSYMVNTKIWVHNSAYKPKIFIFKNTEKRMFILSRSGSS